MVSWSSKFTWSNKGFNELGKEYLIYKLKKFAYGLKQSPKQCLSDVCHLISLLSKEFDTEDSGAAKKIFYIKINRDKMNKWV